MGKSIFIFSSWPFLVPRFVRHLFLALLASWCISFNISGFISLFVPMCISLQEKGHCLVSNNIWHKKMALSPGRMIPEFLITEI